MEWALAVVVGLDTLVFQKLLVVVDVVTLVVDLRSEHKTDGARREIVERSPYSGLYNQTLIGVVKQECTSLMSVVKCDSEAAAHGNEQLLQSTVGMSSAAFASRHVVEPVCTGYVEGHMVVLFHYREVAATVFYLWNVNYFCFRYDLFDQTAE